jgi:hypothetical protein
MVYHRATCANAARIAPANCTTFASQAAAATAGYRPGLDYHKYIYQVKERDAWQTRTQATPLFGDDDFKKHHCYRFLQGFLRTGQQQVGKAR